MPLVVLMFASSLYSSAIGYYVKQAFPVLTYNVSTKFTPAPRTLMRILSPVAWGAGTSDTRTSSSVSQNLSIKTAFIVKQLFG